MKVKILFLIDGYEAFRRLSTNLNSDFRIPRVPRMVFDEYEERGETKARVDCEVFGEEDTLHFTERVPRQCEIQ